MLNITKEKIKNPYQTFYWTKILVIISTETAKNKQIINQFHLWAVAKSVNIDRYNPALCYNTIMPKRI